MKILVYISGDPARDWANVAATFPDHEFLYAANADEAAAAIPEAEVLVSEGATIEAAVLDRAQNLKWLQVASAGVERLATIDMFRSGRVTVTNARVLLATHVAETAVGLLTALTRGIAYAALQQADHRWDHTYAYDELADKRALVVGTGGIGRAVGKRYRGLEMQVEGVDIVKAEPDTDVPVIHPISELSRLLPSTDVLTICCPHTEETHHLINSTALAALPDDAYVINISRGKVVDTTALALALRNGTLRGAGLDVVEEEPLPPESDLWDVPNLIITPHMAGRSPRRQERIQAFVTENIDRYIRGAPLLNLVDTTVGY
ncbi:MAG: hydroxyacid dehydrogenase [Chloroflexi bacterium]|nr:hydroxyacid dehydrogenase [Chloroflexota bacterium]HCU72988.1 hydroxyacid dehydrogenase [Chloroflexota bacterium]|tara:strand:+ start:99 stop:1055 length:957 start_codon:yes stop_codon:yes gene_type:complete